MVKLGNFEYAIDLGSNKYTLERSRGKSAHPGQSLRSHSRSPGNRGQRGKSNTSTLEYSVYRLINDAENFPSDRLADWLPPELWDNHANTSMMLMSSVDNQPQVNERWTCPISTATDVYSLAKLLRFLWFRTETGTNMAYGCTNSLTCGPITSVQMLLKAALQSRPEERLPMQQFHRLLIHLFWNEYDSLVPPKPLVRNPVPCPLRLCFHHWPLRDRFNSGFPSTSTSHSADPVTHDPVHFDAAPLTEVNRIRHITYRKRAANETHSEWVDDVRPEVDQGAWTPRTVDSTYDPGAHPSSSFSDTKHLQTRPTHLEVSSPTATGTYTSSYPSNGIHIVSARNDRAVLTEPEHKRLSAGTSVRCDTDPVDSSSGMSRVTAEKCLSSRTTTPTNKSVIENNQLNRQESARSKLSRFYPFINEWLKRKRITSSTVMETDSSNGASIFDGRSNLVTTPFCRAEVITPTELNRTVTPLVSCLQRSSIRKSKTVKLSHTQYVELAAVPCVPEGVDVPPDLVPRRNLSAPQPRTRVHRSHTISPSVRVRSDTKTTRSVMDGCPYVTQSSKPDGTFRRSTSLHNKIVHSPFKFLTPYSLSVLSRNSEHMPVKPASHLTRTAPVQTNYAEVTGTPDLIRSSSRLSRRRYRGAFFHQPVPVSCAHEISDTDRTARFRSASCSRLTNLAFCTADCGRLHSQSVQTESAWLCDECKHRVETPHVIDSTPGDNSSMNANDKDVYDTPPSPLPPTDVVLANVSNGYASRQNGWVNSNRPVLPTPSNRKNNVVGRIVELLESRLHTRTELHKTELPAKGYRHFWTPKLGLRDTDPHPVCPRSLTRIQVGVSRSMATSLSSKKPSTSYLPQKTKGTTLSDGRETTLSLTESSRPCDGEPHETHQSSNINSAQPPCLTSTKCFSPVRPDSTKSARTLTGIKSKLFLEVPSSSLSEKVQNLVTDAQNENLTTSVDSLTTLPLPPPPSPPLAPIEKPSSNLDKENVNPGVLPPFPVTGDVEYRSFLTVPISGCVPQTRPPSNTSRHVPQFKLPTSFRIPFTELSPASRLVLPRRGGKEHKQAKIYENQMRTSYGERFIPLSD
ncbi:hypothetical protein FGIG_02403 [Fasciola gigantica]|uniref:Protein kinase domain-containing protein n=1 Tax=Fasciola gigantica TaxID=46835 RepID=A0A504YPQ4_FASGI|nr:hypothetical protein FGIG_02403 [Fasciola gigantica]